MSDLWLFTFCAAAFFSGLACHSEGSYYIQWMVFFLHNCMHEIFVSDFNDLHTRSKSWHSNSVILTLTTQNTVEHQIVHKINILWFSWGRTNSQKWNLLNMDGGDFPHSSSAKIKPIASVVAEKNIFLDLHLYEHLKLGRLWNNSIVFFYEQTRREIQGSPVLNVVTHIYLNYLFLNCSFSYCCKYYLNHFLKSFYFLSFFYQLECMYFSASPNKWYYYYYYYWM